MSRNLLLPSDRRSGRPTGPASRPLVMLAAIALLHGCADGASTIDEEATLALAHAARSGDQQHGMTGRALGDSLRVLVTRDGRPVPGARVEWRTMHGSIAGYGPSDARGIASATWILPTTPGVEIAAQAVLSDAPASAVTFTATASHPEITLVSGNEQQGVVASMLPELLVARVTWQGAPVSGEPVAGSGGLSLTDSVTDANGLVRGRWQLSSRAGVQYGSFYLRGLRPDGRIAVVQALAVAGPAAVVHWFQVSPGETMVRAWQRGKSGSPALLLRVSDAHGNPIAGTPVSARVQATSGARDPVTGTTDSLGHARLNIPIDTAASRDDFVVIGSASDLVPSTAQFRVYDLGLLDQGWGWFYWNPNHVVGTAGTPIRLYSEVSSDCVYRVEDVSDPRAPRYIREIGPLMVGPSHIVEQLFETSGTYVGYCTLGPQLTITFIVTVLP